jgi:hypothetical protein
MIDIKNPGVVECLGVLKPFECGLTLQYHLSTTENNTEVL